MSNTPIAEDDVPVEEPRPAEEEASWFERLLATFDGLRLFDFDDLGRRDLDSLPLALERRFIAYPRPEQRCPD